jgi:hypothetical protein
MARIARMPLRTAHKDGNSWSFARYPCPGARPASSIDENRSLAYQIVARGSGGRTRTPIVVLFFSDQPPDDR